MTERATPELPWAVQPVRVSGDWLALREPADAAARATDLVDEVRRLLPSSGRAVICDLGCGSGSMSRWLAPRLPGEQHWIMYDRDPDLLDLAAAGMPAVGMPAAGRLTVETRRRDITRLGPDELAGASLITASALLDMMTSDELDRFVATCAAARCPVLLTISVVGRVEFSPADPLDDLLADAFNAHQRRITDGRRLLGPDAAGAAHDAFARLGADVQVRPSRWRLGAEQAALAVEWFSGWVAAACQQRPDLVSGAVPYARRRMADAGAGRLTVTVQHVDLLAVPGDLAHERASVSES
jgi:trans-aconitate methyltransferase